MDFALAPSSNDLTEQMDIFPFLSLPLEIQELILDYFDVISLVRITSLCRELYQQRERKELVFEEGRYVVLLQRKLLHVSGKHPSSFTLLYSHPYLGCHSYNYFQNWVQIYKHLHYLDTANELLVKYFNFTLNEPLLNWRIISQCGIYTDDLPTFKPDYDEGRIEFESYIQTVGQLINADERSPLYLTADEWIHLLQLDGLQLDY